MAKNPIGTSRMVAAISSIVAADRWDRMKAELTFLQGDPIMDRELFDSIMSDATVIDVDFSEWDKRIRLCVVGVDMPQVLPGRLPLFTVDFVSPLRFNCEMRHSEVRLDDPEHHFTWNIEDFEVEATAKGISVRLLGAGVSPHIEAICEDVNISPLDTTLLDRLFKKWNRPYAPLARPSIKKMLECFVSGKVD